MDIHSNTDWVGLQSERHFILRYYALIVGNLI